MTVLLANVDVTTDTFDVWLSRTNDLVEALRTKVVTASSNTTTGNAAITGTFSANGFVGNTATFSAVNSNTSNFTTVTANTLTVNVAIPITSGGTGANTAPAARDSLGLEIGVDILAFNARVDAFASMVTANNSMLYFTSNTGVATTNLTSYGRSLIASANANAAISVLGLGSGFLSSSDIGNTVQAYAANLTSFATKTAPSGTIVGTTDTQTLSAKTIEAPTISNGYTEETYTANTSTSITIDLANGSLQILTLTGNCTFTFPAAAAGKSFTILLKQDGTGSRTATWPGSVGWPSGTAPTITATASKMDIISFTSDGTNWYGRVQGQNY